MRSMLPLFESGQGLCQQNMILDAKSYKGYNFHPALSFWGYSPRCHVIKMSNLASMESPVWK